MAKAWIATLISFFFAVLTGPAQAALIAADTQISGLQVSRPAVPQATFDLVAFSKSDSPAVDPNATAAVEFDSNRIPQFKPVPGVGGQIKVGKDPKARTYTPLVGFRDRAKPVVVSNQNVTSTSGFFEGKAIQEIVIQGGQRRVVLGSEARQTGGQKENTGKAAGEAKDPFPLAPGNYAYAPFISLIELETDTEFDFAGVTLFATDSRFSEPLWLLAATLEGSDFEVFFSSHESLGLNDALIQLEVMNAFSLSADRAVLSSHELFQRTLVVPTGQTVIFAETVNAGVQRVPTSGTLLLVMTGVWVLMRRRDYTRTT